jgi:hypothetical protein
MLLETMTSVKFNPFVATDLCKIMGERGSDKGSLDIENSWPNYTTLYYQLFNPRRTEHLNIFELGLGTNNTSLPSNMGANGRPGASLYGWREFFPNAQVYGGDIDKDILFESERIKTYYVDQTDRDLIRDMWQKIDVGFDIIVDDGLHAFEANKCFFENSIYKLNAGGFYIIEDILNNELSLFQRQVAEWNQKYPECMFEFALLPSRRNTCDNNLLIVRKLK